MDISIFTLPAVAAAVGVLSVTGAAALEYKWPIAIEVVSDPEPVEEIEDDGLSGAEFTDAVGTVISMLEGEEVTGEQIRQRCEDEGIYPTTPHAWGAAINTHATESKNRDYLLVRTGQRVPMQAPGSNARKTDVYLVTYV